MTNKTGSSDLGWQDTVLWLDDPDKYLARGLDLGTLGRVLGDDPTVVVMATMRTSQLEARRSEESRAVAAGRHHDFMSAHRQGRETRKYRGIAIAICGGGR